MKSSGLSVSRLKTSNSSINNFDKIYIVTLQTVDTCKFFYYALQDFTSKLQVGATVG